MDINIDFSFFPTGKTKTLGIIDNSHYHLNKMSNAKMYIVLPGFSIPVEVKFKQSRINIFNSHNLAMNTVTNVAGLIDLPDGLYKIRYEGNIGSTEYSVEKNLLRIEILTAKFLAAVSKLDLSKCNSLDKKDDIFRLTEIEFLIYSAVANANNCNIEKAMEQYRLANTELDKFLSC